MSTSSHTSTTGAGPERPRSVAFIDRSRSNSFSVAKGASGSPEASPQGKNRIKKTIQTIEGYFHRSNSSSSKRTRVVSAPSRPKFYSDITNNSLSFGGPAPAEVTTRVFDAHDPTHHHTHHHEHTRSPSSFTDSSTLLGSPSHSLSKAAKAKHARPSSGSDASSTGSFAYSPLIRTIPETQALLPPSPAHSLHIVSESEHEGAETEEGEEGDGAKSTKGTKSMLDPGRDGNLDAEEADADMEEREGEAETRPHPSTTMSAPAIPYVYTSFHSGDREDSPRPRPASEIDRASLSSSAKGGDLDDDELERLVLEPLPPTVLSASTAASPVPSPVLTIDPYHSHSHSHSHSPSLPSAHSHSPGGHSLALATPPSARPEVDAALDSEDAPGPVGAGRTWSYFGVEDEGGDVFGAGAVGGEETKGSDVDVTLVDGVADLEEKEVVAVPAQPKVEGDAEKDTVFTDTLPNGAYITVPPPTGSPVAVRETLPIELEQSSTPIPITSESSPMAMTGSPSDDGFVVVPTPSEPAFTSTTTSTPPSASEPASLEAEAETASQAPALPSEPELALKAALSVTPPNESEDEEGSEYHSQTSSPVFVGYHPRAYDAHDERDGAVDEEGNEAAEDNEVVEERISADAPSADRAESERVEVASPSLPEPEALDQACVPGVDESLALPTAVPGSDSEAVVESDGLGFKSEGVDPASTAPNEPATVTAPLVAPAPAPVDAETETKSLAPLDPSTLILRRHSLGLGHPSTSRIRSLRQRTLSTSKRRHLIASSPLSDSDSDPLSDSSDVEEEEEDKISLYSHKFGCSGTGKRTWVRFYSNGGMEEIKPRTASRVQKVGFVEAGRSPLVESMPEVEEEPLQSTSALPTTLPEVAPVFEDALPKEEPLIAAFPYSSPSLSTGSSTTLVGSPPSSSSTKDLPLPLELEEDKQPPTLGFTGALGLNMGKRFADLGAYVPVGTTVEDVVRWTAIGVGLTTVYSIVVMRA